MTALDRPLRFCIVTTFYPPYNFGGDGIYAHRLANSLARRGHQVTVLHSPAAYRLLAGRAPDRPYDDHPRVRVEPVQTPMGKLGLLAVHQTGYPWLQGPALARLLDGESHDVIHYNNVSLLGGPKVFLYGSGLKLCTLIEHWLVCPMHVLWKFDREVCTKPSCFSCTLHGGRPPQLWRYGSLMSHATRAIDAFIGPSEFTIRMHRERGIRGTMIQLPLFHPQPKAPPEPEPGATDRRYFLFVGRLEKIKGLHVAIPVLRRIPEVELLVAGDGNYRGELERLAADAPNIRFLGRVDHEALQRLYRGAIATVVPSICYETFGVVAVESFSASTPVVVYAQSSLEEIVRIYGGGLLYRTPKELEQHLRALLSNQRLRDQLAREGRAAYEKEFAEEPFIANYVAVVRELLARKEAFGSVRMSQGEGDLLAGRRVFY